MLSLRRTLLFLLGILAFGLVSPPAQAMPILVTNASGELLGADNLDLGALGTFDVRFQDGSCIGLFSGCDNAADDFAFQTSATAQSAALALINDVFTGAFSMSPSLYNGCQDPTLCVVVIPWSILTSGALSAARSQQLAVTPSATSITTALTISTVDTTATPNLTWAIFSPASTSVPVPAPPALALFVTGLLGLLGTAAFRRKVRSETVA